MKIILVKHGETEEGTHRILLGALPGILTAQGKKEMIVVAQSIVAADLHPELIISSKLTRAVDSAEILANILNLPILQNAMVNERGGGVVEGKKDQEIEWSEYEKISLPYRKHKGVKVF